MHERASLEQRFAVVEEKLSSLKRRIDSARSPQDENWLDRITGAMKDFPEFDEVVRLGAEIRRADQVQIEP